MIKQFYISNDSDNGDTVIRNGDHEIIARMVIGEGYNEETDESIHKTAKLFAAGPKILEALQTLKNSFIHAEGNTKGNKAKTDVIKYNNDVQEALNKAFQLLTYQL